jgi:hypothetical protein
MRKNFNFLTIACLLFALSLISACGSGASSNASSPNKPGSSTTVNNTATTAKTENSSDSRDKETKDSSPLSVTMDELFPDVAAYDSEIEKLKEKYDKREVMVSDAFLWKINTSDIYVTDSRTTNGNYIVCTGDFSAFSESKSKVEALKEQGRPLKATIK